MEVKNERAEQYPKEMPLVLEWAAEGNPALPGESMPLLALSHGHYAENSKAEPAQGGPRQVFDCVEGPSDVKDCTDTDCPIWPYRFGRNPAYSEASRNEARKRLATRRFATKSASSRQILERTTAGQEEATGVK